MSRNWTVDIPIDDLIGYFNKNICYMNKTCFKISIIFHIFYDYFLSACLYSKYEYDFFFNRLVILCVIKRMYINLRLKILHCSKFKMFFHNLKSTGIYLHSFQKSLLLYKYEMRWKSRQPHKTLFGDSLISEIY